MSGSFGGNSREMAMYTIMSYENDNVSSSFPNTIHFTSFLCLWAMDMKSSKTLNRNGNYANSCFSYNTCRSLHLWIMSIVIF